MLYLEVGPLREREFTGIPQVTAAIAEQMLSNSRNSVAFFFGRQRIDKRVIEDILRRRSGRTLGWYVRRANSELAPDDESSPSIGIYPNVKTARRVFDYEVQLIHDLSALLTPQFHTRDTIEYHARTLQDDIRTNDLTVCVSDATRSDVISYLKPANPDRIVTIHLAHSWAAGCDSTLKEVLSRPGNENAKVEPFVLILGTIEPRKNIGVVLDFLRRAPGTLDRVRFVFVGRHGWGEEFARYLDKFGVAQARERGRIVFTGFVSEEVKYSLMSTAHMVIYPSLFEGFGLPVLEALSLGRAVLTTRSSSIPEVGGEVCYYFDPFTEGDFDLAFQRAYFDVETRPEFVSSRARRRSQRFSWRKFYGRMLDEIAVVTRGGK